MSRFPGATQSDLRQARELRESLYALGRAIVGEMSFGAEDLAVVNRYARRVPPAPQLGPKGMRWSGQRPASLLAVVGRAGVELLGGVTAACIRACDGAGCSILFLDQSRAGDRRWCSMAACGNRAKIAEFRTRIRER